MLPHMTEPTSPVPVFDPRAVIEGRVPGRPRVGFIAGIVITAACLIGFTRRAPQLTAFVVLVAFGLWISWAFGYGKVDHDRLTILVAFAAFACTPRTGPNVEVTASSMARGSMSPTAMTAMRSGRYQVS